MKEKNKLIRVYTGTEVLVILLKDKLEEIGIQGLIKNDFNSGIIAGFSAGAPSNIDLFIREIDINKAETVINEFIQINNG